MQKDEEIFNYNEEEFLNYLKVKRAQEVIFGGLSNYNMDEPDNSEYLVSDELLEKIVEITVLNNFSEFLGEEPRKNIKDVIGYMYSKKPYQNLDERKEQIGYYNMVKESLNSTKSSGEIKFYRRQLFHREALGENGIKKLLFTDNIVKDLIPSINESICNDYNFIYNIALTDDVEFVRDVVPTCLLNHDFISTFNMLLEDYPEFLTNEKFKERLLFVLKNNQRLIYGKDSVYQVEKSFKPAKTLIKRTNKIIKKIK